MVPVVAGLFSGSSGEESASNYIQVIGRIQLFAAVGLCFHATCQLGPAVSKGGLLLDPCHMAPLSQKWRTVLAMNPFYTLKISDVLFCPELEKITFL